MSADMNDATPPESTQAQRETLQQLLGAIRRKIFAQDFVTHTINTGLISLPLGAFLIAGAQWTGTPISNFWLIVGILALTLATAAGRAYIHLRAQVATALAFDSEANLQDRVTSALSFLETESPTIPQRLQINDAIDRAREVNSGSLFRLRLPAHTAWLSLGLILIAASLFVPLSPGMEQVQAAVDPTKELQLDELKALTEDLATDPEMEETLKELRELEEKFEQGEITDRDLMIELARLDEKLRQKNEQLGVQHLEGELNTIIPHLMGSAATQQVATALKENQMNKAVEELEKLAEQARENKLSDEQKQQMAVNFGAAAAKLGQPNANSFAGEFATASESLESSNTKGFCSATKAMGDKFKKLNQALKIAKACKKIGECKACIGQCNSNVGGYKLGAKKKGNKKGGLAAGTAASDEPLGEASRLSDSYRQLLQVAGQAGEGPIETETEITEGQLSPSQLAVKDLHAEFAAVAEEAIENETIPLSHRFHVKRYFQTIRPKE